MNFKKGFTLIELLVVIAIIGILSGIVLTSLGSARNKAKDASAQGSLSSMRAQAELSLLSNGAYPSDLCSNALGSLTTAINGQGGTVSCGVNTAQTAWAAAADLPTGAHACVDSSGYSGSSNQTAANEVAAGANSADVSCNNG